jgi:hypothetical protein
MLDSKVNALYLEALTEQFMASNLYTVEPCKILSVHYLRELRSVKGIRFEFLT